MKRFATIICILLLCAPISNAQPKQELVEIQIVPQTNEWECEVNDRITFQVQILRNRQLINDISFNYKCYQEKLDEVNEQTAIIKSKPYLITVNGLKNAGFMTCEVWCTYEGKRYSSIANVAVSPNKIEPYDTMPYDFKEFWCRTLKQARTCELKPRITLLPERCTAKSNVYHVSFNNDREDSRIYGILSIPKGKGCHPAILNVPGAGCRPYEGDTYLADDGFISLTIGIHGIPVTLDKEVYDALFKAGLDRYWEQDLYSRDLYYYKRVYTGAVRAVDYIFTLPEFDGKRIAVSGGSQGGALSIIVAALDPRVTCYTSFYPALCDVTAYLHGRAAGWPAMFKGKTMVDKGVAECAETALYYSTTNFARLLKCPGFYSWGYNDQVCPPSSVYATYNSVSAPKEKYLCYDTGHWNYPEQWACKQAFIKRIFNIKK